LNPTIDLADWRSGYLIVQIFDKKGGLIAVQRIVKE
jgi:hypothetical protein